MVIAPRSSLLDLSRLEINIHENRIPVVQPTAGQMALYPDTSAKPGSPIRSQALSPDARSLKATTQGPNLLPAMTKSASVRFSLNVNKPTAKTTIR